MSTSKEIPGKEEAYSDEEQKLLVSLLSEYSERLLHMCKEIDEQERKNSWFQLCLLTLVVAVFVLTIFLSKILLIPMTEGITLVYSVLVIYAILVIFASFNHIRNSNQRTRLLISDTEVISIKLEKVIRIASQAHEHVIRNAVNRIEIDLRLTDAEFALQRYTTQFSQGKKMQSKKKVAW
jgi:hypothetical protein